ncbi:riboflavin specific deaminase [Cenarchaeum symbiosum A]|uniref:Riboflavin specific deaminase n=1 Tax=Cenarchaeum symbiosum (strain A) TaxID=414004 RepID=A0RYF3_CENSY|nr:riboflavin specific deaminase [Cenarchaeum symbiosum A]
MILGAAASVDGRIATRTGDSGISSARDLRRVHRLRSEVDGIMVGRGTVVSDDPLLTARHRGGRNPVRIIIDPLGRLPPESQIARTAGRIPTIVACTGRIPPRNRRRLEGLSVEVLEAGTDEMDLLVLLRALYRRGLRTILLEGGARTNWGFIERGLVDEMIITIAPVVIGGTGSVPLVGGRGFAGVHRRAFRLKEALRQGDEVVLHYVKRAPRPARN